MTILPHELSRVVELATLRERKTFQANVVSTPEENKALAERYAILSVEAVSANVKIRSLGQDMFRVQIRLEAQVTQACGLSLEPVPESITDEYEEVLTTSQDMLVPFDEADPGASGPTELISHGEIDYGEIVAQLLALALEPFPRAPGHEEPFMHIEHSHNPFEKLTALQANSNKKKKD
jgi:uncharacterized metal-binding protein YceD (DUF177 family)